VNLHIEKAQKANRAADAIASSMAQTLLEMRPAFADRFDIDEQLVTLAIAQAAMGVAANAASKATGMLEEERAELNDRLNEVVFDAMNELLTE
jgi:regulator of sigma D